MRKHARSWVIKLLLGLVAITFVISFGVGQFTASKLVLVEVGGKEILASQYNREYEREMDKLREGFPNNADILAQQLNLRRQVYNRMIDRELMLFEAARQGLRVTDREVSDSITGEPFFQVDNQFDFSTYQAVLSQNRITTEGYEERTRRDLMLRKFQRNLVAGMVVGGKEIDQRYRIENELVEVEAFLVDPEKLKGSVTSDGAAEKAYYDAHKDAFTQPRQIKLSYFVLALPKIEPAVTVRERAVERYYERFKEDKYTTPKKVRARHILKKLEREAPPEQVEKVRAAMTAILDQLRKGAEFTELAKKHSDDFTKDKGGDLGFFTREEMLPEFSDVAFALQAGETSDVVRTGFGLHLINVVEVEPGVTKTFEEVKPEIERLLRTQRAERKLDIEASRLPERIAKEGIEAVAKEWKMTASTSGWFDGRQALKGLGSTGPLYRQVQRGDQGDTGVWRRNPVQGHVFYRIAAVKEPFLKPFADVQKLAAENVVREKSEDAALGMARASGKTIKSSAEFRALAKKHGFVLKTTEFTAIASSVPEIGANREFQNAAFRLSKSNPLGLSVNGKQAHLLFLKKRHLPENDREAEAKSEISARLESGWVRYFLDREMARLKSITKIELVTPDLIGPS